MADESAAAAAQGAARRATGARAAWLALALAACWLPYIPSLDDELVWDDRFAIGPALDVDGARGLAALWTQPFEPLMTEQHGGASYYRPLVTTTLALERMLFGDAIAGFRLSNFAWHGASVAALFALALALGASDRRAGLCAALFAIHPAHAEPVCLVMGRSDPVASVFVFAAIALALRARAGDPPGSRALAFAPAALVFVGAFAKEVTLLASPVVALAAWTSSRERGARGIARAAAPIAIAALLAIAARLAVPELGPTRDSVPMPDGLLARAALGFAVIGDYLVSIALPVNLGAMRSLPPVDPFPALQVALGVLGAAAILGATAWFTLRRDASAIAPALFAATLFPLCFPPALAGIAMADRFLYIPTAALALALVRAPWRAALAIGVVLSLGYAALLPGRIAIWNDQVTLVESMLRDEGESAFVHSVLAAEHRRRGALERARDHALRAHEISPDHRIALEMLVQLESQLGRSREALAHARAALEREPEDAQLHYLLGIAQLGAGDAGAAASALERATALDPTRSPAHAALALARLAQGDEDGAIASFREAARLDPRNAALARRLSELEAARAQRGGASAPSEPSAAPSSSGAPSS